MWYKYTTEYYSAIKRNEIGSFAEMWMDLKNVIQSDVKSEREKYHILMRHYFASKGPSSQGYDFSCGQVWM